MKKDALRVTSTIPVVPTTLYLAWLNSEQHGAMIGSTAKIDSAVGGKFSIRDGYISGKHVALDLGRRLVLSWRTSDFPRDAHDSKVEIYLEALGPSTRVTILHTEIPEGLGEKYRALWNGEYLGTMRTYFSKYLPDPRKPPPPRRPPPPPEDDEEDEDEEKPLKKGKAPLSAKKPPIVAKPTPTATKKAAAPPPPSKGTKGTKPAPPPAKKPAAKAPPPAKKASKAPPPEKPSKAPPKAAPKKTAGKKPAPAKKK